MESETAVYIHIPFCKVRCIYCDFVTYAGKERLIENYVQALCSEIELRNIHPKQRICSVYLGGGTPSRLPVTAIKQILNSVRSSFELSPNVEITMEMNPCDVRLDDARMLVDCGINRVSLGMQSAQQSELKAMGRRHDHGQTQSAVSILRTAGIENLSLDLIYGYPGQSDESWTDTLKKALELHPEHLSLYALSVEEGSILSRLLENAKFTLPSDEMTAGFYEKAAVFLENSGFEHYEISNWAISPEKESRHNKQYWSGLPYYGFGAGAHGYIAHQRVRNEADIETYIHKINNKEDRLFPAAAEIEPQNERLEMQDCMMLGLRLLREGITPKVFFDRFGRFPQEVFHRELRHLKRKELICVDTNGRIRLNPKFVMTANQAFMEFVD